MQYLLYAIAFYLLILVLPYLIAYLQFRKSILQYPKYEIRSDNSLPVHLTELFQKPIKDLEPFGFEPCSYLLVEQMQKLDPPTTWETKKALLPTSKKQMLSTKPQNTNGLLQKHSKNEILDFCLIRRDRTRINGCISQERIS